MQDIYAPAVSPPELLSPLHLLKDAHSIAVKITEGKTITDKNGDVLPSAVRYPFRYPKTGRRTPKGPYSVLQLRRRQHSRQ